MAADMDFRISVARDESERFLAEQGIKTLRFWNHQMRGELEAIRFEIWHALMERTGRTEEIAHLLPKPRHPSPRPLPSEGRGGRRLPVQVIRTAKGESDEVDVFSAKLSLAQ